MEKTDQLKSDEPTRETLSKFEKLKEILSKMGKVLIAFSGGVDSTFLLKVAQDVLGEDVLAVIASSETYPERERNEAVKLAQMFNVRSRVIQTQELENPDFSSNPPERCYFCKKELFSDLIDIAASEDIPYILDGSNYEDITDFRPGLEAAKELNVRSPLQEAGLLKKEIRQLSKKLDLPTWNKPSLACLSSRFPYHSEIDSKSLKQIDQAEEFLRSLGFKQIRVRHYGQTARIEIERDEFSKIIKENIREEVIKNFKKFGYVYITLDLAGYRTGSMNEPLSFKKNNDRK